MYNRCIDCIINAKKVNAVSKKENRNIKNIVSNIRGVINIKKVDRKQKNEYNNIHTGGNDYGKTEKISRKISCGAHSRNERISSERI